MFLLIPFINNKVNATEINNNEVSVKNFQNVDSLGYLYNFDESPDYIYIDFMGENGYVIFSEETLEILEYTNNGSFPYESIDEQKYYGGPYKYFVKNDENFKNILTNEEISFSSDYIEQISSFSRLKFNMKKKTNLKVDDLTAKEKIASKFDINVSNYELTNSALSPLSPPLDKNNWIYPTGDATYIDNVEYFMTPYQTPRHGKNNGESCTTVAIQLLLSYNNYYNDRRIIAPEYLFGNWKAGSTDIYDRNSYELPEYNPNVCSNPNRITSEIIGSNQAFHDYLFSKNVTGFLKDSQTGLKNYLNNRGIDFNIECEMETTLPFDWGSVKTIDSVKITSKIDEGKPVVISTEQSLNGTSYTTPTGNQIAFNHSVIAYGYQTLAPYTSSGNSNSYLGYIVHMGWDENGYGNDTNIWTNSSWYYSYLSIDINHNHNYNIVINNIIDDQKIEKRCGECGHRTLDDLFVISGNTITDVRYDLISDIKIPREINGIEVKEIGQGVFKDCRNLRKITFPNTIINLDSSAFENCTSLENVILSNKLTSIGNLAFKGCASLARITIPNTVTNIDTSAFEGCSYLQTVNLSNNLVSIGSSAFKGCASLANITIPNTVTNIDTSAFEGCSYLQSVTLSNNLNAIGTSAFKGCGSLGSITIPSSVQHIDSNAFKNCSLLSVVTVNRRITSITNLGENVFDDCHDNLQIVVPTNRIAEYKNKEYWSSYRNKIMPSEDYTEFEIDCEGNVTDSLSLSKATNELYKLNVNCSKSYRINATLQYFYDSNNEIVGFTYNNVKYLYLKNLQNDIIGIVDSNKTLW